MKKLIYLFIIIQLFGCKKKEANFKNFEGRWIASSKYVCSQTDTLNITFITRNGSKKKNSNDYMVDSGQNILSCQIHKGEDYFFLHDFKLISKNESYGSGSAQDKDERITFEISGDFLTISYDGVFAYNNKIKLKRVQ
jgi:hypothetical protein